MSVNVLIWGMNANWWKTEPVNIILWHFQLQVYSVSPA